MGIHYNLSFDTINCKCCKNNLYAKVKLSEAFFKDWITMVKAPVGEIIQTWGKFAVTVIPVALTLLQLLFPTKIGK